MRSYTRVTPGQAVPYRHRDPAWLSPARLAELAARDRIAAARERMRPDQTQSPERQEAARAARIRQFAQLRAAGYSVPRAADAMGVNRSTGRGYERARKQGGAA